METVKPEVPIYENNAAFLLETAYNQQRCFERSSPATPPVPASFLPSTGAFPSPSVGAGTHHKPSAEQLCLR